MSAPGRRVVLIMARDTSIEGNQRLATALDEIAKGGYELVGLVDPEQRMDALRMVVDGMADLVVLTAPEDFPVRFARDLNGAAARTRPMLRPAEARPAVQQERTPAAPGPDHPWRTSLREDRRPRLVGADEAEPPPRTEPMRPRITERSEVSPRERRTRIIRRSA